MTEALSEHRRAALDFLVAVGQDRAERVLPVPGGVAVLDARFASAHNLNRLIVSSRCSAEALAEAADEVLRGAGLRHRLIDVLDLALGLELAPDLLALGYTMSKDLLMARTGPPERTGSDAVLARVEQIGLAERCAAGRDDWLLETPQLGRQVAEQLGFRIETVLRAAAAFFLAVRGPDGDVVARADLYLRDGIGQVEEVMTRPAARRQGLASALVLAAVRLADQAGAGLVFLVADDDAWPQQLYRELGFSDLARVVSFRAEPADAP